MEKYEPIGVVGEGSYGVVLKCRHRESGKSVAIKKFIDSEDDQNVRKIALREIRVLRKLRHENLVNLLEVFRRRKHLYLVFEFIDHTLLDELESKSKGLEGEVARKYVYQILRGLGFCHDNNIIHRDVKPENVLVSKNGIVKLCDFGFARNLCGPGEQLTDYVATRWYRAPELLVGDASYGKEVDIWAVGCLFAEMMTGEPLYPGDSDIDQLFLIAQCLGRLARRHLSIMSRNSAFRGFQFPPSRHGSTASTDSMSTAAARPKLAKLDSSSSSRHSSNSKGGKGSGAHRPTQAEKSVFSDLFPTWNDGEVTFLTLCLDPEPSGRPGCNALLRLPYFTHDNFPSRFINELNQKLQLEGRHPIPAYSTRKKRSVLGTLQHGANVVPGHHNVSHLTKKNPVYQGRLNLAETSNEPQPITTKYSDTFPPTTVQKTPQLIAAGKSNQIDNTTSSSQQQQLYKFSNLTRDQTFLVERGKGSLPRKNGEFFVTNQETRIPSLLSRKYSDDSLQNKNNGSLFLNSTSKSTPNIVTEGNSSNPQGHKEMKRFSIPQQQQQSQTNNSFTQGVTQPRKFSYSFPPPDSNGKEQQQQHHNSYMKEFDNENSGGIGTKLFQPLPVTTLTFSLNGGGVGGGYHNHPYSLSVATTSNSKSPNPPYLNVTSQQILKRTPSPTHHQNSNGASTRILKNSEFGNNTNSNYFPHTHFSTNNMNGNSNGGRYPVSFYQANNSNNGNNNFANNAKSLPATVFGSSMILKNHTDFGGGGNSGGETSSFLPRMPGKTFTGSGGSVKEEEGPSSYSKAGTNSLPRRRESMTNSRMLWGEQQELGSPPGKSSGVTLLSNIKGVTSTKLSNGSGDHILLTTSTTTNNNPRHFSTYGTQLY